MKPSNKAKLAFIKAHATVMGEWEVTDKWEEALVAGLNAAYAVDLETLLEAAKELVENKGPCLDGYVRHVGDHYVEALEDAHIRDVAAFREFISDFMIL